MFLLDTNVISELRRARPHGAVLAWVTDRPNKDLHLSAVTIGELQAGVEVTRGHDKAKADEIERWLDAVCLAYSVLPFDAEVSRQWARLMHRRSADLIEDAMIAATAMVHGLTVVTRNNRDFEAFGMETLNPFN